MATKKTDTNKQKKVSYYNKPENLTIDEWQIALRKQFAQTQHFKLENIGIGKVASDYNVTNFITNQTYKVAIRGDDSDWNFCSCMDFKTNQLGTCKHIEYVLFKILQKRGNSKLLKAEAQLTYTSVYLSYKGSPTVKIRIGTEQQDEFKALAARYFDDSDTLRSNAIVAFDEFLLQAQSISSEFRCYPDALEFVLDQREALQRAESVQKALHESSNFYSSIIGTELFPYQKQGVEFALSKGRCMIADDMGLGKTIQAIGAAEGMKKLYGIAKVLIVCPTSLKYQWKTEIQKFTQSSVAVVEGGAWTRKEQYEQDIFYKICSYNVAGRDVEYINPVDFDLIILDEAQRIKNWKTKTAQSIKLLQSKYCIVLTGTPLENKLEELYSLMQMVNPLLLGALFRFVADHEITDTSTGKVIGYKNLDEIAKLLEGSVLRRHKRDVLQQLPERIDKNLFVPITKEQLVFYNDAYDTVGKLVKKWSNYKFLSEKDRQRLLINLNIMRMACNSTFILDQKTKHGTKVEELMNILDEVLIDKDEKVVIFSQWERMTRLVAQELDQRNIGYENLHGGVPSKKREQLFHNFKHLPESRVFLSTDAGGVGLNLQSASYLINLDLPWNPAVLEQRIARIHRMGQQKKVQIINIITQGTIEEEMLSKLKFKSSLASGILDQGDSSVFLETSKFNELMNQVKDITEQNNPTEIIPQEQTDKVEETNTPETEKSSAEDSHKQMQLFDSEDSSNAEENSNTTSEPQELINTGMNFFGKLLETLADEKKTAQVIQTLVKTDENGDTYLKIPVKNEKIIQNGINLLQQLLGKL